MIKTYLLSLIQYIFILLVFSSKIFAQNQSTTFLNENAGILGVNTFPTFCVGQTKGLGSVIAPDVLVGGEFIDNNWSGVRSIGFNHAGANNSTQLFFGDWENVIFSGKNPNFSIKVDTSANRNTVSGITSQSIRLASFSIGIDPQREGKTKYGIAFNINRKQALNTVEIGQNWFGLMSNKLNYPQVYGQRYSDDPYAIKYASWTEYALTLGYHHQFGRIGISGAITPKIIFQHGWCSLNVNNFEYELSDATNISWLKGNVSYSESENLQQASNSFFPTEGLASFLTDFGLGMTYSDDDDQKNNRFSFKISFLDLGAMKQEVKSSNFLLGEVNLPSSNLATNSFSTFSANLQNLSNSSQNLPLIKEKIKLMSSLNIQTRIFLNKEEVPIRTYLSFAAFIGLRKITPESLTITDKSICTIVLTPEIELKAASFYFPVSIQKGLAPVWRFKMGVGFSIGTILFVESNSILTDLVNWAAYKGTSNPQIAFGLRIRGFRLE